LASQNVFIVSVVTSGLVANCLKASVVAFRA
jgi:hypothetical protein